MAAQVCCVDHERPGTKTIGGRWFCDEHYAKATYKRAGAFRSEILAIIGLFIFVAAVVALDTVLTPDLTGSTLLLVGVVLAIVPAALWLIFFYQQDRLEPEPVGHVARMFVIGLALAGAIGIPLTDQLFRVQDWLYRDSGAGVGLSQILGSIFVVGVVGAFIVYATVRYFIFDSPEFDERSDGVIYGTAAGLGYATALNLQFILLNGGAALGTGEIFVVEVALAHAAFGGLLGYFIGRSKLEQEPVWWLPLGLVLTALLNGAFNILRGQLETGTISIGAQTGALPSFTGLLLAGGLAVVVAGIVYYLINRDIARSLSGRQGAAAGDPAKGDRQSNLAAVGTFVVLLLVGALAWNNAVNGATAFDVGGFRGAYPAAYSDATGEGEVLRVADLGTGTAFAIATRPAEGAVDAQGIAAQLGGERSTDFEVYKVIESADTTVSGKPAFTQRFAYVDPGGFTGAVPEVQEGVDYIVVEGGRAVIITLLTTPDDLPNVEPAFARFLNNLSF
ncbi:MAG TPA: PrsW family glutamic-type intramembrane protease [Anaerolineae bacterium]|nr:PrsW family glutamic-type intramembrane protease [Anaerolineae bacterium]